MWKEEKIRDRIEEELGRLERFASMEKTNIYRDDILEFDRAVQRMSMLYEVLEEVPPKEDQEIIAYCKEKIQ